MSTLLADAGIVIATFRDGRPVDALITFQRLCPICSIRGADFYTMHFLQIVPGDHKSLDHWKCNKCSTIFQLAADNQG